MSEYRQCFSPIEILMVLIIMFLLMAMIMLATLNAVNAANDAERKSNMAQFMKILLAVRINSGTFPVENVECNIGKDCYNLDPVLHLQKLDDIPQDPRGGNNYYKYQSNGKTFILKCIMGDNKESVYNSD
ncbi:MAG: type II secretion system protein [Candidatus Paceibacterota bacterium]|jgi:type II secretory pathway pseudopilin PulG